LNDVELLAQYLIQGNLLGFLVATFTTRLGQGFWALISFYIGVVFYNRTETVMVPAVLWLLLGGFFLMAMPLVSPVAVLLIIMAIAVMFSRAFVGSD